MMYDYNFTVTLSSSPAQSRFETSIIKFYFELEKCSTPAGENNSVGVGVWGRGTHTHFCLHIIHLNRCSCSMKNNIIECVTRGASSRRRKCINYTQATIHIVIIITTLCQPRGGESLILNHILSHQKCISKNPTRPTRTNIANLI